MNELLKSETKHMKKLSLSDLANLGVIRNLLIRWNINYSNRKLDYSKIINLKIRELKKVIYERGLDIVGELPDLNESFD